MTTNKELCTSLEASKLLAKTGLMAGVEADGYWQPFWAGEYTFTLEPPKPNTMGELSIILAYRLDKILAVLPGSFFGSSTPDGMLDSLGDCDNPLHDFILDNYKKILYVVLNRDQNAAVKLAHLLWSNNLIKGKK